MAKSLTLAYMLWICGGWLGLHHFYLERDRQAFIWWCTGGGFGGVGWFLDFFRIPRYLKEANSMLYDACNVKNEKVVSKSSFSFDRIIEEVMFGNFLAWLIYRAIPTSYDFPDYPCHLLYVLIPLGSAIGVHAVSNIGLQEAPFYRSLIGAYVPFIAYSLDYPRYGWSSVVAAIYLNFSVKRRRHKKRKHICKRVIILTSFGFFYLLLWTSYIYFNMTITNEQGDQVKVRELVREFMTSELGSKIKESWASIVNYIKVNGWIAFIREVYTHLELDYLDEKSALQTLELKESPSQQEITHRWRQLSRKWHPDKYRDPEDKKHAESKFMEIQQAYERLSVLSARRSQQRSKSIEDPKASNDKEEL